MISSLDQLLDTLEKASNENDFLLALRNMRLPKREFEKFYTWNAAHYTRNCISKTDHYELDLLCFSEGQSLPNCSFSSTKTICKTIEGALNTYQNNLAVKNGIISAQNSDPIGPLLEIEAGEVFSQENESSFKSVALHLYLKPLQYWDEHMKDGTTHRKTIHYDSIYA